MNDKYELTRVMVVDDDPLMREGLAQILSTDSSIKVVGEATDGYGALRLARSIHPDIVIMDLSMPKLDGVATTRRILELLPQAEVLAISVYTDLDRAREVIEAGAMGYIVKASASRYLLAAVHAISSGSAFFSPGISAKLIEKLQQPQQ